MTQTAKKSLRYTAFILTNVALAATACTDATEVDRDEVNISESSNAVTATAIDPEDMPAPPTNAIITAYATLDQDLAAIVNRADNKIRAIDANAQATVEARLRTFASSIGIEVNATTRIAVEKDASNRVVAFFDADDPTELDSRGERSTMVRKTTRVLVGTRGTVSGATAVAIADAARSSFKLPLLQNGDTLSQVDASEQRAVDNSGGRVVEKQQVTYARSFGGRPVENALLTIDVDPGTSKVTGMHLKNWAPTGTTSNATVKTASAIKSAIITAVSAEKSDYDVNIAKCTPTLTQTISAIVPTVRCHVDLVSGGTVIAASPFDVVVSAISGYSFDEADTEEPPTAPPSAGSTSDTLAVGSDIEGAKFVSYYLRGETRFEKGARKFESEFKHRWSDSAGVFELTKSAFVSGSSTHADAVDLIFAYGHGAPRSFSAGGGKVRVNSSGSSTSQLGLIDAEYLAHNGCWVGTPIFCEGMSATARFTDSSTRESIFAGLHVLNGGHGVQINNTDRAEKRAKKYAQYLDDGQTVLDAWFNSGDKADRWLGSERNGCYISENPETGCGDWTKWDCSRHAIYSGSFYLKSKKEVDLDHRGDYTADPRIGDSGYDIDARYQYDGEYVPAAARGHSLPLGRIWPGNLLLKLISTADRSPQSGRRSMLFVSARVRI